MADGGAATERATAERVTAERATAHRHWEGVWRTAQGRAGWREPEPWVLATVRRLRRRGVHQVLDLGCGVGRHTLAFARLGLMTHALDRSLAGVEHVRLAAAESALPVGLHVGDFTRLPYLTGSLDYVLAWNVVYHGDEDVLAAALAEVRRVLRPGGFYQSTMISKRNTAYGRGVEIARNTFVDSAAADDKSHPHLFVDEHDILRTHREFSLLEAFDREHDTPGSYHWQLLFECWGG